MINTDYKIEALDILLKKDCLMDRYHPLIEYKDLLISGLISYGSKRKSDAEKLTDEILMQIGLKNADTIRLFRRFLTIYEPDPKKFKETEKFCSEPEKQAAFTELYHLPGVKYIRASLYYNAGYKCLADFADASPDDIISDTASVIARDGLLCIAPLPKEVRTHIAVAKAFIDR